MNKPFFSIILPVYNVEDYICRCLESLFDQNLDKELYEIIIVNDGTPDDSMKIVDNFKEGHSNIIIHNQENRGVSSARNVGMSLSSGEYLLFVDPDDIIAKNSLESIYHHLNISKSEVLILNAYKSKCEGNKGFTPFYPFPEKYTNRQFNGVELFKHYNRGSVCGVAYSSIFINNYNIQFNEELKNGEDALFFSMCLLYTKSITKIDIDFYIVYERIGSASKSWDNERLLTTAKGLTQIKELINKREFSPPRSAILYSLAFRFISHLLYRFFEQRSKKISTFKTIKALCMSSGVYPICIDNIPKQRLKIRLLNFSFDVFAFFLYLREIVVRLIQMK